MVLGLVCYLFEGLWGLEIFGLGFLRGSRLGLRGSFGVWIECWLLDQVRIPDLYNSRTGKHRVEASGLHHDTKTKTLKFHQGLNLGILPEPKPFLAQTLKVTPPSSW